MSATQLLRDALFGNPPSINYPPQKEGVLAAFTDLADAVGVIGTFGGVGVFKTTRALLNADLAHDANVAAIVYDDATDVNNDIYFKVGATGTGSWTLTTIVHDLIASAGVEQADYVRAVIASLTDSGIVASDTLTFTARADAITLTIASDTRFTEAFGATGGGQAFTTPGTLSSNAVYLPRIPRGTTTKKWARIDFVLRTGASPSTAGSTVVAYASVIVDPEADTIGPLYALWRNGAGAPITVTQAALGAKYAIGWQAFTVDGSKATIGFTSGGILGATPEASYLLATENLVTGEWSAYGGSPILPVAAISVTGAVEDFIYRPSAAFLVGMNSPARVASENLESLRNFRSRALLLSQPTPESSRIGLGLLGDSWTASSGYFGQRLTRKLVSRFGDGGVGFLSFGTGEVTLDARGLYFDDGFSLAGWTTSNHAGSTSPCLSTVTTTGSAIIAIGNTAGATHPALSAVKLHYTGSAAGAIRWRWNGGAWASANVQGTIGNQYTLDLTGFPTAPLVNAAGRTNYLEIDRTAGSPDLNGVDFQSTTSGIYVHKLGSSGASAFHWQTAGQSAQWRAAITALGITSAQLLLGTNDQSYNELPWDYAFAMGSVADALRTAIPAIDVMLAIPPENATASIVPMSDYASWLRKEARERRCAFLDLQSAFGYGDNVAEYQDGGIHPLLNASGEHPTTTGVFSGSARIAEALLRVWSAG